MDGERVMVRSHLKMRMRMTAVEVVIHETHNPDNSGR